MTPILFLDRDGLIIEEPSTDFQIDSLEKFNFTKNALINLANIAKHLDFYTVLITNQDGLGTNNYPYSVFNPLQDLMIKTLLSVGFKLDEICIDTSFAAENSPNRKPNTGMINHLINNPHFDIKNSIVIGDRYTDIALAKNIGCKGIYYQTKNHFLTTEQLKYYENELLLITNNWDEIFSFLKLKQRAIKHVRKTAETDIIVDINLDGQGRATIHTGIGFFDHMLEQIARHSLIDLNIQCNGDLHIDEHHTVEDVGIALGEAFLKLLANKKGMERYGFALPMDEAEAKVLIDFGGRNAFVWEANFMREKIGELPTEMFDHFFKSFSDAAKCNLHIYCTGKNEHHKIEAIFKAFAKAIKMAIKRNPFDESLPSTKGVL
ncbi:MAG: bifunctional histidinol-phosphatase/imidazoleglycerol-phosphate dehydratase HisB [Sediminibacterium sp.]|nr:bifunctional histidinol-phosphatase/imidazoleglycerol-phosphate dehydratase HisB [Sediminibacterium sp.]